MAKVILMKKPEISVPEGQKGKQIAVKESNITSLKEFYQKNYQKPDVVPPITPSPQPEQESTPLNFDSILNTPLENNQEVPINPIDSINNNGNIIEEQNAPVNRMENEEENKIVVPEPNPTAFESTQPTSAPILENENDNSSGDTPAISLIPEVEEPKIESQIEDEMDPELKEIKERLDRVIQDLNNYKKKIKMLEDEVNQNLEKSREVLKDTQAAAKIMSIQQERQKKISEEINGGGTMENDPMRILQKDAA